jgi:hypothetical protein
VAFGLVRGADCIIDVPITDVDAKSNRPKATGKVLVVHEREEKKKKRLETCLEQSVATFLRLLSQRPDGWSPPQRSKKNPGETFCIAC